LIANEGDFNLTASAKTTTDTTVESTSKVVDTAKEAEVRDKQVMPAAEEGSTVTQEQNDNDINGESIEARRAERENTTGDYVVLEKKAAKTLKPVIVREKLNLTSIVIRGSSRRKVRRHRIGYILSVTSEGWEEPIQISSNELKTP
jgi:hypothetical protein